MTGKGKEEEKKVRYLYVPINVKSREGFPSLGSCFVFERNPFECKWFPERVRNDQRKKKELDEQKKDLVAQQQTLKTMSDATSPDKLYSCTNDA